MTLYNTQSPITREERNNINATWQDILNRFSNLQRQINILAGDNDVDELIQRITDTVNNADATLTDLQTALSDATQLIDDMITATTSATEAANAANQATADATQLISDMTALQGDLEQLQTSLEQSITDSTQATTGAINATTNANQATSNAQQATTNADNAANRANDAAYAIEGWGQVVPYQNGTTYNRNNPVTYQGSTYQSLVDNNDSLPTDDTKWIVLARRGLDGQGAVQTVNEQLPDPNGNVDVGIANINGLQGALDAMASDADLTALEQTVTTHLDKSNPHAELVAKTLYVSVNAGNDTTGDGTSDKPYKTITKALSTLQKVIVEGVKIRVLPGDYTAEGAIRIQGFKGNGYLPGQGLTITAFDGTSDVVTANDVYKVNNFHVFDCDVIYLHGLQSAPISSDYGVFITNTRFLRLQGYKITKAGNSAIGVTGNSFIWVSDSVAQNQDTVLSVNQGSKAVSQNWINSNSNVQGLVANVGSAIRLYDDNQPYATIQFAMSHGSDIIGVDGASIRTPQLINATRDATLTGSQTIVTKYKPKLITIRAHVSGTIKRSDGSWINGLHSAIYVSGNDGFNYDGAGTGAIVIEDTSGSYTVGAIANITNNSFDIIWTKVGAGGTGLVRLQIDVQY